MPSKVAVALIRFYRQHLSARKGYRCAYGVLTGHTTCSTWGLRVFRRHSFLKAWALLQRQFDRCTLASAALRGELAEQGAYRRLRPLRAQGGFVDCSGDCAPDCSPDCSADCSPDCSHDCTPDWGDCKGRGCGRFGSCLPDFLADLVSSCSCSSKDCGRSTSSPCGSSGSSDALARAQRREAERQAQREQRRAQAAEAEEANKSSSGSAAQDASEGDDGEN